MSKPIVSIIIPTYNLEKYIEKTVKSIIAQTYKSIEIIVIDDSSSDNTLSILNRLSKLDDRIKLHINIEESQGPAIPRNLGIKYSIGEYIAFCDGDDVWSPYKLEYQLKMAEITGARFLSTRLYKFQNDHIIDHMIMEPDINNLNYEVIGLNKLLLKNIIGTSSVLLHKSILKPNEGFNTCQKMIAVEDYDLWLRILEYSNSNIFKINYPLVYYRLREDSLSSHKMKMFKSIAILLKEHLKTKFGILWIFAYPFYLISYAFISIFKSY